MPDLFLASLERTNSLAEAERLLCQRELPQALAAFHHAEKLGGEANRCAAGRWMTAMLSGDFTTAWLESDRIRGRGAPDPHRFWNGEDLAGARVIVRCLHGLGDTVQMLRYAPMLRKLASNLIVEVPPHFVPLAPFVHDVDKIITWGCSAPAQPPAWDVQVEIMELPYLFRTTHPELPVAERYIDLPASIIAQAAAAMQPEVHPRVGLVWAGGEWNPARSIPVSLLAPLLEDDTIQFWSLQGGPASAEAAACGLRDATALCGDGLVPLAATIANLDLVITVDTLAAHLAGALGKPVWLMLQYEADWRWMTARDDSPWYPTMRLFRQPTSGDWPAVVNKVRKELHVWSR